MSPGEHTRWHCATQFKAGSVTVTYTTKKKLHGSPNFVFVFHKKLLMFQSKMT